MKKAIISGVSGFVGGNLARYLLEEGVCVIGLDKFKSQIKHENFKFIPMELSNIEQTVSGDLQNADVFYHFAWQGSAGAERNDTDLQLKNAQWTMEAIHFAKKVGCKRFVCAGSIMERETIAAALTPGNEPGLAYIYGSGKLVAHTMAMSVAANLGIELVWALITNAYGAGEMSPRFVNSTIRKILSGEKLQFTAGTQNYDFVYISDVAKAFYLLGENGKPFHEYVIGSGLAQPLRNFILEMKSSLAPNRDFIFGDVPFTGTNLDLSAFDCSDTETDTGFKASVSFGEGVRKTMEWIKEMDEK
ncbi:MAG: NAD(P)-dependent oxidoreductase [Lachnospiraceae bacterium]|nr:NAD(P)-dependent oxidoreductase [Lachnospiraceae bacterium]